MENLKQIVEEVIAPEFFSADYDDNDIYNSIREIKKNESPYSNNGGLKYSIEFLDSTCFARSMNRVRVWYNQDSRNNVDDFNAMYGIVGFDLYRLFESIPNPILAAVVTEITFEYAIETYISTKNTSFDQDVFVDKVTQYFQESIESSTVKNEYFRRRQVEYDLINPMNANVVAKSIEYITPRFNEWREVARQNGRPENYIDMVYRQSIAAAVTAFFNYEENPYYTLIEQITRDVEQCLESY